MRTTSRTPSSSSNIAMIKIAMDADGAEHGVRCASGAMHIEAAGDDAIDDVLDLLVGGGLLA